MRFTLQTQALFLLLFGLPVAHAVAAPEPVRRARQLMGTPCEIAVHNSSGTMPVAAIITQAFDEIARQERIFSLYRTDSELSIINSRAGAGSLTCSPDFFVLALRSCKMALATDGAFDPTVQPLVAYWKKWANDPASVRPAPGHLLNRIGCQFLTLNPKTQTIRFQKAGMGLNFDGIAKGYALDQAALILRKNGVTSALLNFGGQILVIGPGPVEGRWPVEIRSPDKDKRVVATMLIPGGSVSISSQSEHFVEKSGRRYGHILNPKTGQPVDWDGSVTVVAPSATEADGLSTALFVLGHDASIPLIQDRFRQSAAVYVLRDKSGFVVRSSANADDLGLKIQAVKK